MSRQWQWAQKREESSKTLSEHLTQLRRAFHRCITILRLFYSQFIYLHLRLYKKVFVIALKKWEVARTMCLKEIHFFSSRFSQSFFFLLLYRWNSIKKKHVVIFIFFSFVCFMKVENRASLHMNITLNCLTSLWFEFLSCLFSLVK